MTNRLDAIRERAEKATPGPWTYAENGYDQAAVAYLSAGDSPDPMAVEWGSASREQDLRDAEFVAHAREDVPYLLAELESLRARVETAEQEIDAAKDILRHHAEFSEWAQGYLDSGRWAGHDRADAIRQELLERDAQLSEARTKQADAEECQLAMVESNAANHARAEAAETALAEERTRREQAEQEAREATADAGAEMKARLHTEAERDTLQLDLDALRQQIADGR